MTESAREIARYREALDKVERTLDFVKEVALGSGQFSVMSEKYSEAKQAIEAARHGEPKEDPAYPSVHEKVWGREIWMANNEQYCGKILELKKGFRCSLHRHRIKHETFYVYTGKLLLVLNDQERVLGPGDVAVITPGDDHWFGGIEDSRIIEISTQHFEGDSIRERPSGPWDPSGY